MTANAAEKTITIKYSEALLGSFSANDFTVKVNGTSVTPVSVSLSGKTATITLPNLIVNNATVTVDYTNSSGIIDKGSNKLPDASGASVTVTNSSLPMVSTVSTSKADGAYKAGETIDISVKFSAAVTVTGTPTLTLETGSSDQAVNYTSGSGSDTLVFRYTVQSGDLSSDLTYASEKALTEQ